MGGGVFSLAALAAAINVATALEATCWDEEAKEWEGVLLIASMISLSCVVSLPHNSVQRDQNQQLLSPARLHDGDDGWLAELLPELAGAGGVKTWAAKDAVGGGGGSGAGLHSGGAPGRLDMRVRSKALASSYAMPPSIMSL